MFIADRNTLVRSSLLKLAILQLVTAVSWLSFNTSAAADLDFENLYRSDRILDVAITMPNEDWETLKKQTRNPAIAFSGGTEDPFTWFKGDITIAGELIRSVGIRKKGFFGSLDSQYPSLKIRFDEFIEQQPINGVDSLTLNNNKQDESLLSQILAYRLFNAAGVAAPTCNLAHVTVNGEDLGLYSNVESIEKSFLKRRFGNSSGNLYEGTLTDFYPKSIDKLEVKTNKKNHDRSKIERLAQLLSQDGQIDVEEIGRLVDLDSFIRFWAMESLLKFWDGYSNNQNNYWIYEDANDGKFRFIPWGADATMNSLPFPPVFGDNQNDSVYTQSMLTNKLYQDAATAERYRTTMISLLDTVWVEDDVIKQMNELKSLFETRIHPRQNNSKYAFERIRQFVHSRRKVIENELQSWPRQISDQPRKPMYTLKLGTAKGTFTASRSAESLPNSSLRGDATMSLVLEDKLQILNEQSVMIGQPRKTEFTRGLGQVSGGKTVIDIAFIFTNSDDDAQYQLALFVEANHLTELHSKELPVKGSFYKLEPNQSGRLEFSNSRPVDGKLQLTEVSASEDGPVSGRFEVSITETRGGFFDARQNRMTLPPSPPLPFPDK